MPSPEIEPFHRDVDQVVEFMNEHYTKIPMVPGERWEVPETLGKSHFQWRGRIAGGGVEVVNPVYNGLVETGIVLKTKNQILNFAAAIPPRTY